jgi:hypothetical protein
MDTPCGFSSTNIPCIAFERKWLRRRATDKHGTAGEPDLIGLNNLTAVYDHIHKMRVIPFDLRSFLELTMQTVGSLLPLLPYLGSRNRISKCSKVYTRR